jgi:hypothetical protein
VFSTGLVVNDKRPDLSRKLAALHPETDLTWSGEAGRCSRLSLEAGLLSLRNISFSR